MQNPCVLVFSISPWKQNACQNFWRNLNKPLPPHPPPPIHSTRGTSPKVHILHQRYIPKSTYTLPEVHPQKYIHSTRGTSSSLFFCQSDEVSAIPKWLHELSADRSEEKLFFSGFCFFFFYGYEHPPSHNHCGYATAVMHYLSISVPLAVLSSKR